MNIFRNSILTLISLFITYERAIASTEKRMIGNGLDKKLVYNGEPVGRILGGTGVPISTVPYQLSLRYDGSHFCGASILSEYYVLTAAHCLPPKFRSENIQVVSGTSFLNAGGNINQIESSIVHPNFSEKTMDYDIAIIKVKRPFVMSSNVAPITLPTQGYSAPAGSEAIISGWGLATRNEDDDLPNELQYAKIAVENIRKCRLRYLIRGRIRITQRMVCAGTTDTSSCQGDSGGALVVKNVALGITSFGPGSCGTGSLPGVYTNVADPELRSWISANTNGL